MRVLQATSAVWAAATNTWTGLNVFARTGGFTDHKLTITSKNSELQNGTGTATQSGMIFDKPATDIVNSQGILWSQSGTVKWYIATDAQTSNGENDMVLLWDQTYGAGRTGADMFRIAPSAGTQTQFRAWLSSISANSPTNNHACLRVTAAGDITNANDAAYALQCDAAGTVQRNLVLVQTGAVHQRTSIVFGTYNTGTNVLTDKWRLLTDFASNNTQDFSLYNTVAGTTTWYANSSSQTGFGTDNRPVTALDAMETGSGTVRGLMTKQYSTDTNGAFLIARKARGTLASATTVVTGDVLLRFATEGYDGAAYLRMAAMDVYATGTIGTGRVPTQMIFSTATDAATSVLTAALTLKANQVAMFTDGTAAAPSITITSEPTTGLYRSSSTQFGLSISGTNRYLLGVNTFVHTGSTASEFDLVNDVARLVLGASGDMIISRKAAATTHFGTTDAASAVAQIVGVQGSRAGTDTDTAGGALTLRSGIGTGSAVPSLLTLSGGAASATTASTAQPVVSRFIANAFKVLADNVDTSILSCTVASNSAIGGKIQYTIEVTNGTDYQAETGYVFYNAVNKATAVTRTITESADTQQAVSAGTLTTVWAISAANPAVISVTADSSLTPSAGYPRITFSVFNQGQQAVTVG